MSTLRAILRLIPDIWFILITHWPGGTGNQLRYRYYKKRLKHLGTGATLDVGTIISNPASVSIGDNTYINKHCTIIGGPFLARGRCVYNKANSHYDQADGEVVIGQNAYLAPGVYVLGAGGVAIGDRVGIAHGTRILTVSNHHRNLSDPNDVKLYSFSDRTPPGDRAMITGPVVLEQDSGVGMNCIVLPGSTIRKSSWIGVMSVVRGEIPPYCIATGNPASVIRERANASNVSPG